MYFVKNFEGLCGIAYKVEIGVGGFPGSIPDGSGDGFAGEKSCC